MADVVMTGGGMVGLCTAMLLAGDGHQVTVLERDEAPAPDNPEAAWEAWDRRGVNQFRLLHFLLPRLRADVRRRAARRAVATRAPAGCRSTPSRDAPPRSPVADRDDDGATRR